MPGNVPIDEHVEQLLRQQSHFYLLYLDLNHFKPYNDQYGYRQGDAVLRWLGRLLQQHSSALNFVGHIGGDDFVLISQEADFYPLCEQLLQAFNQQCSEFHRNDDWSRGYLNAHDRSGQLSRIPLLGLAIGVVPSTLIENQDPQSLAQLAAQAKQQAKQKTGSAWHCLGQEMQPILPVAIKAAGH